MERQARTWRTNVESAAAVLLFLGGYWGYQEIKHNWKEKPRVEWTNLRQETEQKQSSNPTWIRAKAQDLEENIAKYKRPTDKKANLTASEYSENLMRDAMTTNIYSRLVGSRLISKIEAYDRIHPRDPLLSLTEQAADDVRKMLEENGFRQEVAASFKEKDVECKAISTLYLCALTGRASQEIHKARGGEYEFEIITGIYFMDDNPRMERGHQWIKVDGKIQDLRVPKVNPSQYVPLVGSKVKLSYGDPRVLLGGQTVFIKTEPQIYTLPAEMLKKVPEAQNIGLAK
jgi:hypothetical protein